MRAREEAVSEIVGALLLVLIVSSAAFGFGLFVHQQQKETQAQQAATLAVSLEKVLVASVQPAAPAFDAACPAIGPPDQSWHALGITVTSLHLKDSAVASLQVNHVAVRTAAFIGTTRTVAAGTTAGSVTVTATGAGFLASDLGRIVQGSGIPLGATITDVSGAPGSADLSLKATATAASVSAKVGGLLHDFGLPDQPVATSPGYNPPALVPARQTLTILLPNVGMGNGPPCPAGTTAPYSLYGGAPPAGAMGPLLKSDALDVELVTGLGNHVERPFVPPLALASLEPTPGISTSYTLVGSASQAGDSSSFVVKWDWRVTVDLPCDATMAPTTSGHRALYTVAVGTHAYCVRLTVTDNNGLAASAEFTFSATR
jgi:hypothetical protein